MRKILSITILSLIFLFITTKTFPHCQIPCGIYNDELRFKMMEEHILTIEKAMKQMEELSKQPNKNFNQIVRWVLNKENHADELAHIITQYFLTQRIKLADGKDTKTQRDYLTKITICHEMLVFAMKAKQTTDLAHIEKLRQLLKAFHNVYFAKEAEKHTH